MPSFLSKLLGRKKAQGLEPSTDNPAYPAPLLDGKFEAISPNVSPSAAFFTDSGAAQIRGNDKPKDRESPFSIFRARSRVSSDLPAAEKTPPDVPHLSLHLPITKDRRALDVVFESDPEVVALINEAAIKERRLTPHEALSLVRACSQVIIDRGLDTLGVMHPHWHSTSPEVQHRLISLYLLSITSTNPDGAASPISPTALTTFESELHYTRWPHDVAAVLRWALRHLKLEGDRFGKESGDWTWYNTFAEAERAGSYPPDAFSNSLVSRLPTAHTELLLATLDIISSLSARREANGSSGSKLSKVFGLWLLTSDDSTECDDWSTFYDRWDRAGRILEHLFLARIRNDAHSLPRRLTELVEHYPYDYGVDATRDDLLPRPRFSTRQYDALFVQVDTEYSDPVKPKSHPLRLIADALRAQPTSESATAEDNRLWDAIKKASFTFDASEGASDTVPAEPIPVFSNVFSDETIRLLSLIPVDVLGKDKSASTFAVRSPISPRGPRSFSLPETPLLVQTDRGHPPLSGHALVAPGLSANNSTAPTTASPETPADWLQFSSQGFGTIPGTRDLIATLWDSDIEKTVPPPAPLSRKSSHRTQSRHSSLDSARTPVQPPPTAPAPPISKATLVTKIKVDEAFIDFWADSLLDPSSRRWPRFVLCQLKPLSLTAVSATPTAWLVIEQRFVRPAPVPPVEEAVETTVPPARPRVSSPRPHSRPESSRLSAAFSIVSKKRFPLFTGGSGDPKSPKEKDDRLPQVGEVGEGLNGTGEGTAAQKPETETKGGVSEGSAPAVATVGAVAVGVLAAAVAAVGDDITQTPREDTVAAPSELVGAAAPQADEPVKDESPHGAPSQNGLANDEQHDEEHRELEPETAAARGPAGDDAAVIPPVTSEPVETETEPVSQVEAEMMQPEPVPYVAGIGEGTIAQAEVNPLEHEPLRPEPAAVSEHTAPEPSSTSAVEEALPAEEKDSDTVPTIPLPDAPASEEPKSASAPAEEPTPVPAESALVQAPSPIAPAAIEEPLKVITAPQVAEPEPELVVEATAQNPPADEGSPETDLARTLEEVPVPVAEPVLVCEAPNGASPEGVAEDSPSELASPPAPLPVCEQPAPEDISTVGETKAAATADMSPIHVGGPSATEQEHVPTESAVPVIQTSSIDEGQAVDSADVVETNAPFEEPAVEEDAQLIAIPERDDALPCEPDVNAAAPEPTTVPAPVADDITLPVPDQADSAAAQTVPEAPIPSAEPEVEHEAFVTQSPDESLPSQATPNVLDLVIDEQPSAEETTPIPDAFVTRSIPIGDQATSPEDETDAPPPESAVAEDAPATEPVPVGASAPSENLPPEVPESPVPEPGTAIAYDSMHSHTNGSAEPLVAHAEQINAGEPDTSVTTAGNASIASVDEIEELKAEAGIVAESQATSNEPESAIPVDEPSAPVPEISTFVTEQPVSPTEADILVETPAPAAQETGATTEAAPAADAENPSPTLEPAADVPAPEVAGTSAEAEAPASIPVEADVVPEGASPSATDALVVDQVPPTEESTPAIEDAVPAHDHALAEQPVFVPEQPTALEETASAATEAPADPAPGPEEPVPVTGASAPATEAPADPAPAPEEPVPVTDASAYATEAPADSAVVPEEPVPVTDASAPATEAPVDHAPVPEEPVPVTDATAPATETPAEPAPVPVTDAAAAAPATTEAPADPASVLEEPTPETEAVLPATETPPHERSTPDLDETPAPEELAAVVEDEPAVPEPLAKDPAPLPEDAAPATEVAVPTTSETAEDGTVGLPSAEPAAAEPASVAEEHTPGLEGAIVEADPAVEEPIPDEQMAQEPATASSSEAPAVAASEPEAPPEVSTSSEANGAVNAERKHEVEELADEVA